MVAVRLSRCDLDRRARARIPPQRAAAPTRSSLITEGPRRRAVCFGRTSSSLNRAPDASRAVSQARSIGAVRGQDRRRQRRRVLARLRLGDGALRLAAPARSLCQSCQQCHEDDDRSGHQQLHGQHGQTFLCPSMSRQGRVGTSRDRVRIVDAPPRTRGFAFPSQCPSRRGHLHTKNGKLCAKLLPAAGHSPTQPIA
jgi:hypothetical protein